MGSKGRVEPLIQGSDLQHGERPIRGSTHNSQLYHVSQPNSMGCYQTKPAPETLLSDRMLPSPLAQGDLSRLGGTLGDLGFNSKLRPFSPYL